MSEDFEPVRPKQMTILGAIEAAKVERLSRERTDGFPVRGPAREEEYATGRQRWPNVPNMGRCASGVRWKRLCHASTPWNGPMGGRLRMSAVIHLWTGMGVHG